jgi:hypothetical protein
MRPLISRQAAVQESAEHADQSMTAANADLEIWEHHIESELDWGTSIPTTEHGRRRLSGGIVILLRVTRFCSLVCAKAHLP